MKMTFFLIIKNLNADKAHEWDNISIRMIQLAMWKRNNFTTPITFSINVRGRHFPR